MRRCRRKSFKTLEKDLTFEEIVKLGQNIESAELISGLIMKTGPETNKISEENTETPKYERCGHCGSRHQGDGGQESRKKFCWAWKLSVTNVELKVISRRCVSRRTHEITSSRTLRTQKERLTKLPSGCSVSRR